MSFKDSKIAAAANSAMTLSAELAVDTEEYTSCTDGRYEIYTNYQDDAYSTVDNLKNIAVDPTQINIMQENSICLCSLYQCPVNNDCRPDQSCPFKRYPIM